MDWMELAMDYAYENRAKMMEAAKNAVKAKVEKFTDYKVEYTSTANTITPLWRNIMGKRYGYTGKVLPE